MHLCLLVPPTLTCCAHINLPRLPRLSSRQHRWAPPAPSHCAATSIRRRQGKNSRSIRRRARRRAWRWDGASSSSLLRGAFPTHFVPLLADVPRRGRQCYPHSLRPLGLAVPPAMSLHLGASPRCALTPLLALPTLSTALLTAYAHCTLRKASVSPRSLQFAPPTSTLIAHVNALGRRRLARPP
jgi:hypothetical protein